MKKLISLIKNVKPITHLLILSVIAYSLGIGFTLYWGGLWLFLTVIFFLGLGYDIHSYFRLEQGKPIITFNGLFRNSQKIDIDSGFFIGDKDSRRPYKTDEVLGEKRF